MQKGSEDIEKNREAVAKVLGEPFMLEFAEPVRKMRTHLMIGSTVGLAVGLMGLKVNPNATLLGIQLEGVTEGKMLLGLMLFNIYLLIHFLWSSLDSFFEWKLRLTGTRVTYQTGAKLGSKSADYPSDPRQSTLHLWWIGSAKSMIDLPSTLKHVDTQLTQFMEFAKVKLDSAQDPHWVNIQTLNAGILRDLNEVKRTLEKTSEVLNDARISVSLERFDRRFYYYQKSQTYRWILIEWFLPTSMAVLSILYLFHRFSVAI